MRTNRYTALIILTALWINFSGCKRKIDLGRFNPEHWKRDFNGCDGTRESIYSFFEGVKPQMIGIREDQVLEILGRPNKQNLEERSKKSYLYYLTPGKQCVFRKNEARLIEVEFDALDRVKTISIKVEK